MHPLRILPLIVFAAVTCRADSVIVFNEIMYHPPAATPAEEEAAEWVELVNQMAVDVDMGGWSLSGGADYIFPDTDDASWKYAIDLAPGRIPASKSTPW